MKQVLVTVICLFLMPPLPAGAQEAAALPNLRILNWSEYIDDDGAAESGGEAARPIERRSRTLAGFMAEFNCQITYAEYDAPEDVLSRLSAQPGYFDIVIVDSQIAATLATSKRLHAIDRLLAPNLKHMPNEHGEWEFDPGRKFSAPYLVGSVGVAYRKDLTAPITKWADIFLTPDARLIGKLSLVDDSGAVVGSALRAVGKSGNSIDAKHLREAARSLDALKTKGFVAAVTGDVEAVAEGLRSGKFVAGMMYSGDGLSAVASDPEHIVYVTPDEGSFWYVDSLVIPSDAPHAELAQRFIDYIYRPEVHAHLAAHLNYQCPNTEGARLLPKDFLENRAIFPREPVLSRMEPYRLLTTEPQDRVFRILKE